MLNAIILILIQLFVNIYAIKYTTTPIKNQYPNQCGSCWAHAVTGEITDKLNQKLQKNQKFPIPQLSVQYLLDCYPGIDSCFGKFLVKDVLDWMSKNQIPDETQYLPYQAFTNKTCKKNLITGPSYGINKYKVIKGYEHMKHELNKNPPIICMIQMFQYDQHLNKSVIDGDLCNQYVGYNNNSFIQVDTHNHTLMMVPSGKKYVHIINLINITKIGNKEYYLLKNSFGSNWGDRGFQYIETKRNCLAIEEYCYSTVI